MPRTVRTRLNVRRSGPQLPWPSPAMVIASLALFIALGGLAYAASLPRNSVGSAQLRADAVGSSEIRARAVGSSEIRDRSLRLSDVSGSVRRSLRGRQGPAGPAGPPGPTYHAAINSDGGRVRGNAVAASHDNATGIYALHFANEVSRCQATATLAQVPGGSVVDPPPGRTTVRPSGHGVEVRTYDTDGTLRDLPFNVIVAC
jgi:hypothetical protein